MSCESPKAWEVRQQYKEEDEARVKGEVLNIGGQVVSDSEEEMHSNVVNVRREHLVLNVGVLLKI